MTRGKRCMCPGTRVTLATVAREDGIPGEGVKLLQEGAIRCLVPLKFHPPSLSLSPVLPATHPHLATPELVEVGTPVSVNCSLDGLFPASEATVHLARGDHRPPLTITHNGDSLLAKTWINGTEKEQGTQYLVCEIMLADEKVVTKKNVTFYSK